MNLHCCFETTNPHLCLSAARFFLIALAEISLTIDSSIANLVKNVLSWDCVSFIVFFEIEIDRYIGLADIIGRYLGFADKYRYRPKRPILIGLSRY